MKSTIKFCYNRQRISAKGEATIYIRITINRRRKDIQLDVRWPVTKFDFKAGVCKPRFIDDQECEDNNIIIRNEIGKCNEILRYYRLANNPITINQFYKDYKNNLSKSNFVDYMESKIKQRHVSREISALTYKIHLSILKKLKKFGTEIPFMDFDENWCKDYDNWLKKNIKAQKVITSQNTRWGHHKVIKTYLNLAKRDKISFNNPYLWFQIRMVKGNWKAIFEKDIKKLYNHYMCVECTEVHRKLLRAFLFSCMTGLRISDLTRVTKSKVIDDILIIMPHKTRKKNEPLQIPLNKMARQLFNDAVKHSLKDQIFNNFAEQYANRVLKKIAKKLEIKENLHWHVARHTFISLYYAKTKDLLATKNFAGHSDIKQTMIYTHLNPEEIKDKMKPMDDII